jgi:hypothetical protein
MIADRVLRITVVWVLEISGSVPPAHLVGGSI